ncbi:MAG: carboxypeptidase regulatory-like domain-containing protein, partial [Vicinamibacterales bacterium]
MRISSLCSLATATFALAALSSGGLVQARQAPTERVIIDADDIGGVVASQTGPEAGVWVIAETTDLPTKFRKIVVTDDRGRYVLPDLPKANYRVWVRGYGLVDSRPVSGAPGQQLALAAVKAPTAKEAAAIYPANYWLSLLKIPARSAFPGTGPDGNGIGTAMRTQDDWINQVKSGCQTCHQLGSKALREIPKSLGVFDSTFDAWNRRTMVGQDGAGMMAAINSMGKGHALGAFADWTDRIMAGEVPPAPPRPQGVERNLVLTSWDWGAAATFAHDVIGTDKRTPTRNANGQLYGVDWGNDAFLMLDPVTNTASQLRVPVLDPRTPAAKPQTMPAPSPYWGEEIYWTDPANPNHMAMDSQGRVWMAARFRVPDNQPAFCQGHASSKLAPQERSFRQVQVYDPKTKAFKQVNTCFDTHHVQLANDRDETLYSNGVRNGVLGWVKTRVLLETGDEAAAQGWCKGYFDVNGDGKIDPAVEDTLPMAGMYSVAVHPTDGSVWGAVPGPVPGRIVRIDPKTCIGESYEPPYRNTTDARTGYTPRGIDIDSNGLVWTALAGSGHLANFDRSKCKVKTGRAIIDGQHCPEGWTLHRSPGPRFQGVSEDVNTDYHYYNFVDVHDTLGLGRNIPLANGTGSDSLLALQPNGQFVILRVPYPQHFFTRGMDGRIDDPNGGWKGRGLYGN